MIKRFEYQNYIQILNWNWIKKYIKNVIEMNILKFHNNIVYLRISFKTLIYNVI